MFWDCFAAFGTGCFETVKSQDCLGILEQNTLLSEILVSVAGHVTGHVSSNRIMTQNTAKNGQNG